MGCKHDECNEDEGIVREIQGIGIKNYANYIGDHMLNLDTFFADKDVRFPTSEKEEIIITYRDKCENCNEYVGDPYNIVYGCKTVHFGLNKGEYNGRIHSLKMLDDVNEIDEARLDPNLRYICLELSNYQAPFNDIEKIYIQRNDWNDINNYFINENDRSLEIGDHLYELVIDKQNRVLNYSIQIKKEKLFKKEVKK